jgi:hypothetical protein
MKIQNVITTADLRQYVDITKFGNIHGEDTILNITAEDADMLKIRCKFVFQPFLQGK